MSVHEKRLYMSCSTWGPVLCSCNSPFVRDQHCGWWLDTVWLASSWVSFQNMLLLSLKPLDVLESWCLFQIIRPCHLTMFGKFYLLNIFQQKPVRQQKS